jgi:two-component system, NtrC family, sensor kinase
VASRWRIRHKLALGLGLVVGIMALLLSGTLRGLWSYYLTTNSIRSKLAEKDAAEEFRSAVADLTAPDTIKGLVRKPENFQRLPGEVKKVRDTLDAYQEKLEDTLGHTRDPLNGDWERDLVAQLHKDLTAFERAVDREVTAPWGGSAGDEQHQEHVLARLDGPIGVLRRNANDLRAHISKELTDLMNDSRKHYQAAVWIIVPSGVVGLLVLAGLMRSFYAWVFNPIRDLEASVGRVARGDFSQRIELHSGDEMEDLGAAFNDMMRRLQELYADLARQVNERSRQLVRSERLASVGFLAAGVAHEINNPLASIAFCSEALDARLNDLLRHLRGTGRGAEEVEVFRKYLTMIQQEAFRCKNITERLLRFSRSSERKREPVDLTALVQSVVDVTQHLPNHKGKQIECEVRPDRAPGGRVTAWANADEIKSVVLNLVVNALESMDEGGRLTVRLSQRDGMAELQFRDTGCGMTREVLENIFEPFFTRSRTGKGTGLGLTISHQIITGHGGEIEAASEGPGKGSTFVVRLPARPQEQAAGPEALRVAA